MTRRIASSKPFPPDAVPALDVLLKARADTPKLRLQFDEIDVDLNIAQLVYDARVEAGLTQSELAARIGTTQSAVSRLEDAEYRGHSLRLLVRIARVLSKKVELRFVSNDESRPEATSRKTR